MCVDLVEKWRGLVVRSRYKIYWCEGLAKMAEYNVAGIPMYRTLLSNSQRVVGT